MFIAKMPTGEPEIYGYIDNDKSTGTVQGEGLSQGLPCVFVRLSNCNLRCAFCDTWFTWYFDDVKQPVNYKHNFATPVKREEYQMQMTAHEVANYIRKVRGGHRNVVFTGGEPLMQQLHLVDVMRDLRCDNSPDWHFEVETNGTFKLTKPFAEAISQINCSPKLKSSGNLDAARMRPEAIKCIIELAEAGKPLCFKFVVFIESWEKDMAEIQEWEKANKVPKKYIYLMPEGIKRERMQEATAFLNKIASKENYKVSTRAHILVYGDKRGV